MTKTVHEWKCLTCTGNILTIDDNSPWDVLHWDYRMFPYGYVQCPSDIGFDKVTHIEIS